MEKVIFLCWFYSTLTPNARLLTIYLAIVTPVQSLLSARI